MPVPPRRAFESLLALTLVAAAPSCRREPPRPSVLLVTVDTLRADHLGCYGYERPTSPRLDALAAAGARMERALAPIPRTTQSLASLLTGRTTIRHRVRSLHHRLDPAVPSMVERYAEAGYDTAAYVVLPYFRQDHGLAKGFDTFDHFAETGGADLRAEVPTDAALEWLRARGDRPFFLWVHYRDPHYPYFPPAEVRDRFDPTYEGPYEESFRFWAIDAHGRPIGGDLKAADKETTGRYRFGHRRLPERDVRRAIALYDAEIVWTDRHVGRLLDGLSALGRDDDTIVTMTADHGESFGEHGYWFDHGENLFDPSLRVPLLMRAPDLPPTVVEEQVGLIDVAPTLLDLCRLPALERIQGRSLRAALEGKPIEPRALFAESGRPFSWEHNPRFARPGDGQGPRRPRDPRDRLRALSTRDGVKLVLDPRGGRDGAFSAYRPADDPGELRNLLRPGADPGALAGPMALLGKLAAADEADLDGELDDETRRALEQSGYLLGGK